MESRKAYLNSIFYPHFCTSYFNIVYIVWKGMRSHSHMQIKVSLNRFDKEKGLMMACLKSETGYLENLCMCCVTLCSNTHLNKGQRRWLTWRPQYCLRLQERYTNPRGLIFVQWHLIQECSQYGTGTVSPTNPALRTLRWHIQFGKFVQPWSSRFWNP